MALGIVPPSRISRRVRKLVDELGAVEAARRLGVGREAAIRVSGGLGVRRGTLAVIEKNLGER